MDRLDRYNVDLKGVATGMLEREWHLEDDFFVDVRSTDILSGSLDVCLTARAVGGAVKMLFRIEGEVQVPCDRCLGPVSLPVSVERELTARWGEEYEDDGDSITIPEGTGEVNVAWNIYEFISLEVPLRHVHPDGQCPGDAGQLLGEYSTDEPEPEGEAPVDERWSELKKILDNNK